MIPRSHSKIRVNGIGFAIALTVSTAATPVLAQNQAPVLGGPSVIKVQEVATVSGNGLPANTAVTVLVVAPSGAKAAYSAVTNDKGRLEYRVIANASGRWGVFLLDSGGRQLAATAINFMP